MVSANYNIKVSFKFFNIWVEHKDFMKIVEEIWQNTSSTNNMKNIWMKLKNLRTVLRKLNNEEFKFIKQKIKKARQDFKSTQEQIQLKNNIDLLAEERKLLQELKNGHLWKRVPYNRKLKQVLDQAWRLKQQVFLSIN